MDVTGATGTTLDVMLERRMDDYWNIEWDRDVWTGFTRFTILDENLQRNTHGPVRFVDRIHTIHHIGRKTFRWVFMVRGAVDEETIDIQA